MIKKEILDTIVENAFAVAINMNDTFYYACADVSCISIDDLEDLEPVIEKYGYKAFVAFEALKRGHDPQIPEIITKEFVEAKDMITKMMNEDDELGKFYELKYTMKRNEELSPTKRRRLSKLISFVKDSWYSFFY